MTVTTNGGHGLVVNKDVIFTGLAFTCGLDNGATTHFYPRGEDPTYNTAVSIASTTGTTITIDVGISGVNDQYAHTFVSATAGAVKSGGNYQHQFVEAVAGCISITGSTNTLTPTAADYNPAAGIITFTSAAHGLTTSDSVRISTDGIVLRCAMDNYASLHSYPRTTDPIHDTAVSVASTTANTFSLDVGASPIVSHNVSAANYDAVSGIMTMTIGAHTLKTGTSIKLETESLTFKCAKDGNATNHRYPRKPDPYYNGTPVTKINSATQFEVNVGVSTVPSFYVGLGSVQGSIIAPRAKNNSASKSDPALDGSSVINVLSDNSFEVNTGISTCPHFYARGGKVDKPFEVIIDEPLSYSSCLLYTSPSPRDS